MDKKGIALAFNTIIIGIVALLVLVIIVFLLFDNIGNIRQGTACTKAGGRCITEACSPDSNLPQYVDGEKLCEIGNCCSIVPG